MYWELTHYYYCLIEPHEKSFIWLSVNRNLTITFGLGGKLSHAEVREEDVPEDVRKAVKEYMDSEFFEIDLRRFKNTQ